MSENKSSEIIKELKLSFIADKKVILDQIVEVETEIRQCKEYISTLNQKDNCDYNVFSPRSASRVYKDLVAEKKIQIEELEGSLKGYYKELSNVTKKLDSLNELDTSELHKEPVYENTKLLKLQEDDRKRIAADLHDTVLQNLTLVIHNLELTSKFIDTDPIRAKLEIETNRRLVKDTVEEIRSTIFDLRPMQFDDFGFVKTLDNLIMNLKNKTRMNIVSSIDDLDGLDNVYLLTSFRVIQELANNAIKHSNGNIINITLTRKDDEIDIIVYDNGTGIKNISEKENNHFGLKILEERVSIINGSVEYDTSDTGMKVKVNIPL